MNIKLLKELYKQAETECGWSEEKFAELIIEEACQAFWSEACNVSDLAYEEYRQNSKKIKQHFEMSI